MCAFLCVLSLCSGLNWDTFPLHAVPGLWDYVSCVDYAALHGQQHTTGKINSCIISASQNFLKCFTSFLKEIASVLLQLSYFHFPSLLRLPCFSKCFRKSLCTPQQAWNKNPAPQCSLPPWFTVASQAAFLFSSLCAVCGLSLFAVTYKETGHDILI